MHTTPQARSYFELGQTSLKFSFPLPGPLDRGTRNKGKTLMEMKSITFTYPGAPSPQIIDVSVRRCPPASLPATATKAACF